MIKPNLITLARCPFCGHNLSRDPQSVVAHCETHGCLMHTCKITVDLGDHRRVEQWNTRTAIGVTAPAQAILDNLRDRKVLKYLFEPEPENVCAYGMLDKPIDLETQIECAETLARCAIGAAEEAWRLKVRRAEATGDAIAATLRERIDEQTDDIRELREALHWYATQVGRCRMITSDGDEARKLLDADCGQRARDALGTNT